MQERRFVVRPITTEDRSWVARFLSETWGSTVVVSRGKRHKADRLPGFIAVGEEERIGLITFRIASGSCEVTSINSIREGQGVGSALMEAVIREARASRCRRLWLITTNDNTKALRWYQKRGLALVALHRDAMMRARQLKPAIPDVGADGIPIRDEIELELRL